MADKLEAILKINPNAKVEITNGEVTNWYDTTPISEEDIQAKMNELQTEYDAEEWKGNRQAEYPSHEDCIHALLDGGETLENLQTLRQTIKNKYPKE